MMECPQVEQIRTWIGYIIGLIVGILIGICL